VIARSFRKGASGDFKYVPDARILYSWHSRIGVFWQPIMVLEKTGYALRSKENLVPGRGLELLRFIS
jgi:hypothetical protein